MELVQNVPFFCIMISMFSGTVSSVLPAKHARRLNVVMICLVMAMTGAGGCLVRKGEHRLPEKGNIKTM